MDSFFNIFSRKQEKKDSQKESQKNNYIRTEANNNELTSVEMKSSQK